MIETLAKHLAPWLWPEIAVMSMLVALRAWLLMHEAYRMAAESQRLYSNLHAEYLQLLRQYKPELFEGEISPFRPSDLAEVDKAENA